MSERKERFTPGPWEAYCEKDFSAVYGDGGNIEVCYCDTQFTDDENRTVAHNATLIAAAPEMYELLDRIRGRLEFCKLEQSIDIEAEREIRQLLAKARGEAK